MRRIALLKSALVSAAVLVLALPALPALAATKAKETGMVAAAHPLAVEAGVSVLRRGGSAVDAAVAVQAALGLVEPQSSGIGGGAFITYYDSKTRKVTAYNGRETAPMGASPAMFLGPEGKPLSFVDAVTSGGPWGRGWAGRCGGLGTTWLAKPTAKAVQPAGVTTRAARSQTAGRHAAGRAAAS